ncbi:2-dehydropantoate 2-reductase [Desulfopila sp. IMCC35006]|uniref:ketopantoate reductase family protein n=1 Tax=Desulfopila sp. IMCC35006 TaxID=2569542 RepID=UPI0010AD26B8|nr:2-dehydropantoate 2-reductase [Desulfopila sp. IMCC35006]TKB24032.1 2-dehydropantoate 2-reductase [Desulfopila sp. IMCC35006]
MQFLLVGPGALGCLLSSVIIKGMGDHDRLTILDHNAARASQLTKEGITYHLAEEQLRFPVAAVSDPQLLDPVDIVILCVKSYDVINSLEFCKPILSKNTLLVFLQNGISHLDLKAHQHKATAAFGTTTEGATLLGPGQVRHAGSGTTYLGFLAPPNEQAVKLLQKTREVFSAGGLDTHLTDNILTRLWAKLFVNAGINALTAILDCNNGELLTLPGIDRRMKAAIDEAMQIAEKKDIPIMDDPYQATRMVCSKTAKNVSSMLQDVRKKRRTEIDAINGALVALGHITGIDTPENSLLCQQIKDLETSYVRQ